MTSDFDELSETKRQNSKAILIWPQICPIKTVDLNGKTPFPNKTRVKLFFPFNKTKLRDFERFYFNLGDHGWMMIDPMRRTCTRRFWHCYGVVVAQIRRAGVKLLLLLRMRIGLAWNDETTTSIMNGIDLPLALFMLALLTLVETVS